MASEFELVERAIPHAPRLLLFGPPGTGKTFAAQRAGNPAGSVYSLTLTEETPAAELRGHYVPKGQSFVWHDGPAIRAWREGGRLILNEIDQASPDCWSLLMAVCDNQESASMTLPTGETVQPAAGFHVVATMNGEPEDLREALADRFPARVRISEPAPAAIAGLPADLQDAARGTAAEENPDRHIGLRAWLSFADLREPLGLEDAAALVFGNRAETVLDSLRIAASPETSGMSSAATGSGPDFGLCPDCRDLEYLHPADGKCFADTEEADSTNGGANDPRTMAAGAGLPDTETMQERFGHRSRAEAGEEDHDPCDGCGSCLSCGNCDGGC